MTLNLTKQENTDWMSLVYGPWDPGRKFSCPLCSYTAAPIPKFSLDNSLGRFVAVDHLYAHAREGLGEDGD